MHSLTQEKECMYIVVCICGHPSIVSFVCAVCTPNYSPSVFQISICPTGPACPLTLSNWCNITLWVCCIGWLLCINCNHSIIEWCFMVQWCCRLSPGVYARSRCLITCSQLDEHQEVCKRCYESYSWCWTWTQHGSKTSGRVGKLQVNVL